jgi:hypothetical protein
VAKSFLADADPTTRVFVRGTASVAGRDAYELVVAPRSTDTLVADVVIDVDSATSLPLRVQVMSTGSGTPALDVGFSSIDLKSPPDSTFAFTPPPGATVKEATSPDQLLFGPGNGAPRPDRPSGNGGANPAPASPASPGPPSDQTRVLGSGWTAVVAVPNAPKALTTLGRPVSGPWGSGRLITSTVADALVLDDGTVLVGLVGPDRLQAAATELRHG